MTTTWTITAMVPKATTCVLEAKALENNHQSSTPNYLARLVILILPLSILTVNALARRRTTHMTKTQQEALGLASCWQEPWLTKDWPTLYGLIALAHSSAIPPTHTPFQHRDMTTIQTRSQHPHRFALGRLLEKGVIPLGINDGGVSTTRTKSWCLMPTFPYITLPRYRQEKSRAYLEMLIPRPDKVCITRLISILGRNRMGYAISIRTYDAGSRECRIDVAGQPVERPRSGARFLPLSVGAESVWGGFLPFWGDREMVGTPGDWLGWLEGYLEPGEEGVGRIPLVSLGGWAVVRIESGHWGYVELDHYVLGAVEDAGMEGRWVGSVCEERARGEMEGCGLEI